LKVWVRESLPQRLLLPTLNCIPEDPCALDVQLREGGVLQFYHGNTSILRLVAGGLGDTIQLQFDSYETDIRGQWPNLKREWTIDEADELAWQLREIVPWLVSRTKSVYYKNKKEGFWENQLCHLYGRYWTPDKEWLVLDRQAVIGFPSSTARTEFFEPIISKRNAAMWSVFSSQARKWAHPRTIGTELDLLLLNRKRELVCMELKHASSSAGVYYGPFQAAVYREAFCSAADSIVDNIETMAKQKLALLLLPAAASSMFPITQPAVVHGVLAVVGTPSIEVQGRLEVCLKCCAEIEHRSISEEPFLTE